jgi:hypothetical protein
MAKGKKTGGRDFYKGHKLTPPGPGRPAVSPQIKAIKQLNATKLAEMLNEFINMDKEALIAKSKDPSTTVFELIICSILKNAYDKGDQQRINFILDRLVGKVKDQVEHTGDGFKIILEDYLSKKDD